MTARLIESLATTDALAEVFSDRAVLQAMLDFEVALARAAAEERVIPAAAADAIERAARTAEFDAAALARDARESGTIAIPLVRALKERVRAQDPAAAACVHAGATSQDATDSALMIVLRRARPLLERDHALLSSALRRLSDAHAGTVMLGRTLLQAAAPITFGLKVAGWYAPIERSWRRLSDRWEESMLLQFGGAVGTRAAAGPHAGAMANRMAAKLGLRAVPPWHTGRDRLGALMAASGLYTAVLGKAAGDIALLMQTEVAEVSIPGGGSSSMPHKRNPAGCAAVLAAATRMPGLIAAFLGGMVQEHERSLGAGHAEWPTVAAAVQATGAAVSALAAVVEDLTVNHDRMRANVAATNGAVFAERAVTLLRPVVGDEAATGLVASAVAQSRESGRSFADVLREMPDAHAALPARDLASLDDPGEWLGEAEALRKQLLEEGSGHQGAPTSGTTA